MNYNFDEIIDRRHTNALNTDGFRGYIFHAGPEKVFAFKDEEFVRMWVADMEFGVAPEILDALRARIDRRIFGYTGLYDDEYYHTFSNWCKDHYNWHFPKEQLCISPGIIPALYQLTEMLCTAGEKVLLNTPAYGYFLHAAEYAGVDVLTSPLHKKADDTFAVDFEDFERKCADPACKLVFWCNPHNPTGRMWTEDELRQVAAIIEKYNLWVVSDEIHCDLIRCAAPHPDGKGHGSLSQAHHLHGAYQDLQHGGACVFQYHHPRSRAACALSGARQAVRHGQPHVADSSAGGLCARWCVA